MQSVMNVAAMPTGDVVRHRDSDLRIDHRVSEIERVSGQTVPCIDANLVSEKIFGDTVYANVIMLGFAWQSGLIPVSERALLQAIELNGVAIENNYKAFSVGRIASDSPNAHSFLLNTKTHGTPTSTESRWTYWLNIMTNRSTRRQRSHYSS